MGRYFDPRMVDAVSLECVPLRSVTPCSGASNSNAVLETTSFTEAEKSVVGLQSRLGVEEWGVRDGSA